jgi:putative AlgH/UPF0301 family transcriptional regulator
MNAFRAWIRARSDKQQGSGEMNSYQGQFLVAARHQLDPNFAGMVILVVEH